MSVVNFGVIGCGVIGPQHIESICELPQCHLRAVGDIDESRAAQAREKFAADTHYSDPIALLDDPQIEAVVLALPAGLRADLAVEAFKRGKHVMLEKPAARNLAEYDGIIAAVEAFVAENPGAPRPQLAGASARYLLMPHSAAVRDYIASGSLGEIRSIHFRNLVPPGPPPVQPPPAWRVSHEINGGGILVNWSSYEIDYIFGVTGWKLDPKHVLARWWPISPQFSNYVAPGSDADEDFCAMITCAGGEAIYLERGERVASAAQESWRITGSRGSIALSVFPLEHQRIIAQEFDSDQSTETVVWEGKEDWADSRRGIIRDFADSILSGKPPQTDQARSRVIQQVIDAIYLSGNENRPVEIR